MTRNRASAKKAGSSFERLIADHLAENVDDRIDRRVKNGTKDRGDIGGWRFAGLRIVAECKNVSKLALGTWWNEALIEKANDDADVAMVVHKRHGKGAAADQWVTLTVGELLNLLHAHTKENQS
jgi:hypothetical protein